MIGLLGIVLEKGLSTQNKKTQNALVPAVLSKL